mmetsp:Transcript_3905/g.7087  ORF Transcript_3905/g.7087 Transcript_3905/m.7087 type:complete len:270 (+) Transcript_3905:540-1349(+)
MNSISVQHAIGEVECNTTHVLVTHNTFLGSPLHSANHGIPNFGDVLHSLGDIHEHVRTSGIWGKAPNLLAHFFIHAIVLGQDLCTSLEIVTSSDLTFLDGVGQSFGQRLRVDEHTVVLVRRLGQADTRFGSILNSCDGLTVGNDRVGHLDLSTVHKVILKILQADFNVQLTAPCNNVLSRLLGEALYQRIGLGQSFQTFNQLGKIGRVLGLHSHTHDWGHRVLHVLEWEGILQISQGARLDQHLVQPNQSNGVSARHRLDRFRLSAHHQ